MGFTKEQLRNLLMNPERTGSKYMLPDRFNDKYEVDEDFVDGFRMVTVYKQNNLKKHVYFIHGGGFVMEFCQDHTEFVRKLAEEGMIISCIDFPLTPEYTAKKTMEVIFKGYERIIETYEGNSFYVIGDSAGGGMAVTLLMMLRDNKVEPIPEKSVLASPWLDLSMTNPEIKKLEKKEKVLPLEMANYISEEYRGGIDPKDPFVSPIYGDLRNLGEILMFFSDSEVMRADCELFIKKINESEGSEIKYSMGREMIHDYVLTVKNKQSEAVFKHIVKFLLSKVKVKRKELLKV